MKTLPRDIATFGFVERERVGDKKVINKCGRDFLYYALHYYYPTRFNPAELNPLRIEHEHLFGTVVPAFLAWTQVQFVRVPRFLRAEGLTLAINGRAIRTFFNFVTATLLARVSSAEALRLVEQCVDDGVACGIDVSLGYGGLLDHVLFVYGYDEDNLYVCDTHQLATLEYTKLTTDHRFYMQLPKAVVRKRWSMFGRVWVVQKNATPRSASD